MVGEAPVGGDTARFSLATRRRPWAGGRSARGQIPVAADHLRALLPHADVDTLPHAGHDVTLRPEDRDHVVERVLDFVARTSA